MMTENSIGMGLTSLTYYVRSPVCGFVASEAISYKI